MGGIATEYFKELFSTSCPTRIKEVANLVPRSVTPEMNEQFTREFQREEVIQAIHTMHPTKAPGPNGVSAIFYQKYWDVIGNDITNIVLNVLNSNASVAPLNQTNIALIPKINSPAKMNEFRPISLCNVSYKIISKVLANRLKPILSTIILENQSVFVPDHLITDNVLIAFEIMHYFKKKEGKESYVVVKLDMSKAYDWVEWCFLKKVMESMGFNEK